MATNTPFGQRLGLVLEGGAMRGIYTAGVLDVFLEAGIMPDVVVGGFGRCAARVQLCSRAKRAQHPLLPQIPQ